MAEVSLRVPDTLVRGPSAFHPQTRPNQPVYLIKHDAREKLGSLNRKKILTFPQGTIELNILIEKKVVIVGHF